MDEMMHEVILSNSARKEFLELDKVTQERILNVLERIRVRPHVFCVKLAGSEAYRVRVGKYRVILDINDKVNRIEVLKIGNRENIYK